MRAIAFLTFAVVAAIVLIVISTTAWLLWESKSRWKNYK